MDKLPVADTEIEGELEASVINDPAFRKFLFKNVKSGNRHIHRLIDELKRDPEFREAVRARAEKIEQYDISIKHMPSDIKAYAQFGLLVGGMAITYAVMQGVTALERALSINLGFVSISVICLSVIGALGYWAHKKL